MPKSSPSLIDKPLPSLEKLNLTFEVDQVEDKAILVCFFDMNQRPSRNCIMQLSKRTQELKAKDIAVIVVQASNVDEGMLSEWVKKNDVSFPVGMIQNDEEQTRFNWGVKSLPWLILIDNNHIVAAEGFGIEEIGDHLNNTGQ